MIKMHFDQKLNSRFRVPPFHNPMGRSNYRRKFCACVDEKSSLVVEIGQFLWVYIYTESSVLCSKSKTTYPISFFLTTKSHSIVHRNIYLHGGICGRECLQTATEHSITFDVCVKRYTSNIFFPSTFTTKVALKHFFFHSRLFSPNSSV